ncbi:MAG: LamG-like jellyroll fold domain-containing protein [Candidatus Neomarinimicrobiota bacterium]
MAEQIPINRVEQIPNLPTPYLMRDWEQVALGYDSLVFDLNRTGQYLPLIWINNNTINYSSHSSFGLHTVVGTPYPNNAEAINTLPAVVGATLVGVDKSNQSGHNWVLGCEEWFNRRPEENVYLNNYVTSSGDDWWYSMMPNVFFYQLYALYPGMGDFEYQFQSVADQWLRAVRKMGGDATPWKKASMNYRGWYLATMAPFGTGVKEPESAGSIAWLLYNAYRETAESRYLNGAEWAMEFLSDFPTNAAYELQLPYGVYTAARMNAELGTTYDVQKMLNWCFDPSDNVRQWGVTLGRWGDYDCYGLVGEAKYTGYAFAMNGFEMAGALVPMVRYDDRFARAIGKWVLNMANASRLFYAGFLPDSLQDGETWAHQYDPNSYIAHESMRQYALYTGVSPFATGDAVDGNWGETNFALYGSSHVGILGGIIDTTNVAGILQLDLLKTDYFQDSAYPSYLFYNPHAESKTITLDVGDNSVDIYDAVTNQYLALGVSGPTTLEIPADAAVLAVYTPAGGISQYDLERLLIDGIVVDYHSGQAVDNYPPRIKAVACDSITVVFNQSVPIYCTAADRDGDDLSYSWTIVGNPLAGDTAVVNWTAPATEADFWVVCAVSDGGPVTARDSIRLTVIEAINTPPSITDLSATPTVIALGDTARLVCHVSDPDGDSLIFDWSAAFGLLGTGDSLNYWVAPDSAGYYHVLCQVSDNRGGEDLDSVLIVVRDSSGALIDDAVAWYPFSGNTDDFSAYGNHGTNNGVTLVADRFGNADQAGYFDGTEDNVRIFSSTSLNFQDAITVSFWMKPASLPSYRESYPISHGNWENRWKVSILPEKKIRWTIKTTTGIIDLDSQTKVATNIWYHVIGRYDGSNFDIYLDGSLNSHTTYSGSIMTTAIDLMIGQCLPTTSQYNFNGVLDDIRIYDRPLSPEEIALLYNEIVGLANDAKQLPESFRLEQNYPNPFNPRTTIQYQLAKPGQVRLEIIDIRGRIVDAIVNEYQPAGYYSVVWNADNSSSGVYFYRLQKDDFTTVKKCIKLK